MATTTTANMSLINPVQGSGEPASIWTSMVLNNNLIDVHDHTVGKGLAVKRIQSGTQAGRPAASFAGQVYVDTDAIRAFYDNGSVWNEFVMNNTVQGQTIVAGGLTVTAGGVVITAGGLQVTAGNVGIGATPAANIGLSIGVSLTPSAAFAYGVVVQPVLTAQTNSDTLIGLAIGGTLANNSKTGVGAYGISVNPTYSGASGATLAGIRVLANSYAEAGSGKYGLIIDSQTGANASNNGILVDTPSGGTTNIALKVNGGKIIALSGALGARVAGDVYLVWNPTTGEFHQSAIGPGS